MQSVQVIFLLLFPYFIIKLTKIAKGVSFLSPILLAYIVGIIIGNVGFIPVDRELAMSISEIMVPLAIPLILFATDLTAWMRLAEKTITSFLLVLISVLISSSLAAFVFSGHLDEYWKLSGMLIGVYTGGTPNLMAVGMGLDVNRETLLLANGSDAIMGGVYLLFLLSGAKWVFGKFLPPFQQTPTPAASRAAYDQVAAAGKGEGETKEGKFDVRLGWALLLTVVFTVVSLGLSHLWTGQINVGLVMLLITTFGLGASFVKKIRGIKGTYEAGQYLILVFSLAIGININLNELLSSSSIIFFYTAFVMTLSILTHLLLAVIFRIDVDTMIITSTAGIYGPAFIGPVASGIKNKEVILSGLVSGLVGYALGNYLGFSLAWFLKLLIK